METSVSGLPAGIPAWRTAQNPCCWMPLPSPRFGMVSLAGEAILSEEKRQVTNRDNSRCLKSFEQYALCFFRTDRVILAIVTEGSEMEEIATNLFRSLAE